MFRAGPPPAHTGGFGEPTCTACHTDATVNEPGGGIELLGAPASYEAGRTYTLTLGVRRDAARVAGFQLSARYAAGDSAGASAGELQPADSTTAIVYHPATFVPYLEHTHPAAIGAEGARWMFRWTAPARRPVSVVFHIAANAGNDDNSPLGDYVYLKVIELRDR